MQNVAAFFCLGMVRLMLRQPRCKPFSRNRAFPERSLLHPKPRRFCRARLLRSRAESVSTHGNAPSDS
jgi:hypothetical protein